MGNRHPSTLTDITNCTSPTQIQQNYYNKVYLQHRKTPQQFSRALHSIIKRTQCLPYPWAQQLAQSFSNAQPQQLYTRYKAVMKKNCTLDGRDEEVLLLNQVKEAFEIQFRKRRKILQSNLSLVQLEDLIKESKCFFMLLAWLQDITSLQNDQQETISGSSSTLKQKLCSDLVYIAELCFQAHSENHCDKIDRPFNNISAINQEIKSCLILLKRRQSFNDKIAIMLKIEQQMNKDEQIHKEQMKILQFLLGRSKVLAHILIVTSMYSVYLPKAQLFLNNLSQN